MSERILVEPTGPMGYMPLWTVDTLIEDLKDEGLDARLAHEEHSGGGAVGELVIIWIADNAGSAMVTLAVQYAIKWLRHMFRKYPDVPRRRVVEIRLHKNDKSRLYERIEMTPDDEEPVRHTTEAFEQWTQRKPPVEGVKRFEQFWSRMTITEQIPEDFEGAYEGLLELAQRVSYVGASEEAVRKQVDDWRIQKCRGSRSLAKAAISALRHQIDARISEETWNKADSESAAIKEFIGSLDRGLTRIEAV
ncbi:hypothetical protein BH24ACT22_BH24ACT22_15800 [soil metagenome]